MPVPQQLFLAERKGGGFLYPLWEIHNWALECGCLFQSLKHSPPVYQAQCCCSTIGTFAFAPSESGPDSTDCLHLYRSVHYLMSVSPPPFTLRKPISHHRLLQSDRTVQTQGTGLLMNSHFPFIRMSLKGDSQLLPSFNLLVTYPRKACTHMCLFISTYHN